MSSFSAVELGTFVKGDELIAEILSDQGIPFGSVCVEVSEVLACRVSKSPSHGMEASCVLDTKLLGSHEGVAFPPQALLQLQLCPLVADNLQDCASPQRANN